MIRRGLCVLAMLSNCVLSLPLTPGQKDSGDVKVMKCIVEALAEVLSRPRPLPVSQDCLVTLKSDDRLVSILRHRSFLKELQEVALEGGQEGAEQSRGEDASDVSEQASEAVSDIPDRSMLEALGSPGERSILSEQRKAGNGEAGSDESWEEGESPEDNEVPEEKKGHEEKPGSHESVHSEEESNEGRAERRRDEEDDEDLTADKKGGGPGEKGGVHAHRSKSKEEEKEKRAPESQKHQEKHEGERHQRWTGRGKSKAAKEAEGQEAPHHSKEASEEEGTEEGRPQTSPEEKELQMLAKRRHEEKRGSEEEGSASRKSEDQEIESLAAIEAELENAAEKLHELRRG